MNEALIEARRWFLQAREDLAVVRTLRDGGHYAAACFYAQQAGEKALKAVLFSQGKRRILEHAVRELIRQCQAYTQAFAELEEKAVLLDQFYIPTRYPNGLPSPSIPSESYTAAQAEMAQTAAEEIVDTAERFLRDSEGVLE